MASAAEKKPQSVTSHSSVVTVSGKGLKWFEKIEEFDIYLQASFIGFAI